MLDTLINDTRLIIYPFFSVYQKKKKKKDTLFFSNIYIYILVLSVLVISNEATIPELHIHIHRLVRCSYQS